MYNLIKFINKHHVLLLFIFLEILCLIMIVQNNNFYRSSYINSTNKITSNIFSNFNKLENYFSLKLTNELLAEENAKLKFLLSQKEENVTFESNLSRKYISARIINNSVSKRNNYLTLNKGTLHGVKKGMGVTTHLGVIGIIKEVSDNFSSVISILHSKSKLSVILKKSNYFGTLEWDGSNYLKANLNDIPSHVKISIGDTIVTSGYSHIFQSGIPIGIISHIKTKPNKNFHEIKIKFLEDFKKIKYVNLNELVFKNELKILEKDYE